MCLFSETKKPSVVRDKHIICYKVIKLCEDPDSWEAMYIGKRFPFCKQIKAFGNWSVKRRPSERCYLVGRGFFHAFKDIRSATYRRDLLGLFEKEHYKVVKCFIPIGSRYYESISQICAEQMIVTKEI